MLKSVDLGNRYLRLIPAGSIDQNRCGPEDFRNLAVSLLKTHAIHGIGGEEMCRAANRLRAGSAAPLMASQNGHLGAGCRESLGYRPAEGPSSPNDHGDFTGQIEKIGLHARNQSPP